MEECRDETYSKFQVPREEVRRPQDCGPTVNKKKRAAAGHQARGVSLMIHGRITSKRDPDLQKRIDQVVAMAQKKECDHNTDVINGFHHIARASLKCHRVG